MFVVSGEVSHLWDFFPSGWRSEIVQELVLIDPIPVAITQWVYLVGHKRKINQIKLNENFLS